MYQERAGFIVALAKTGYRIVSGGTDNHLMLVDLFGSKKITGKEAEKALEHVGISINKNMIPFDPRKPLDPVGRHAPWHAGPNHARLRA